MFPNSYKALLKIVAILLILILAGPEMGISMELFAILDVMGTELFLLSFVVGFRALPVWAVFRLAINAIEKMDPYFFVPSTVQIRACPGIIAHALPGFVCTYLIVISATVEGVASSA